LNENRPLDAKDRQIELRVAFRNLANAPNKTTSFYKSMCVLNFTICVINEKYFV